jgi:hypothetical protein
MVMVTIAMIVVVGMIVIVDMIMIVDVIYSLDMGMPFAAAIAHGKPPNQSLQIDNHDFSPPRPPCQISNLA